MDFSKLDADLSAELDQAPADPNEPVFSVYIQTNRRLGPAEAAVLNRVGVAGDFLGKDLFTATLSLRALDELSDQPWVAYLKLSRRLRPLK